MKAHLYYCMISIIRTIDAKNESNLLNYKENIKIRLFNIVDFFSFLDGTNSYDIPVKFLEVL